MNALCERSYLSAHSYHDIDSHCLTDSDPDEWTGGPIGLQLVARRLEDEKIVAMLRRIRDALESK